MIQNSPKEEKVQIREVMRVFIKKAKINVSLIREKDFKDRVKKKKMLILAYLEVSVIHF